MEIADGKKKEENISYSVGLGGEKAGPKTYENHGKEMGIWGEEQLTVTIQK